MACIPGCDPDLVNTSADPDLEFVNNLFVNEADEILCYMTGQRVQRWDLSGVSPVWDSALPITNGMPPIAWLGTVMFVLSSDGLRRTVHAIDTTTSPPTELGSVLLDNDAGSGFLVEPCVMTASGSRLYIVDKSGGSVSGMATVDISDPTAMVNLGFGYLTIPPFVYKIVAHAIVADDADDTLVYIQGITSIGTDPGIYIYEFSTPTAPTKVGSVLFGGGLTSGTSASIRLLDGYLYSGVSGTRSFAITNVVAPAAPIIESITSIDAISGYLGIAVQSDWLFLNNGTQLEVWDVSDKTAPSQCKESPLGFDLTAGIIKGDLTDNLYVSSGTGFANGSFNTFDVSTCVSTEPPPPPLTSKFNACKAVGDFGGYLFIADEGTLALKVWDVSDPANPTEVGSLTLKKAPLDIDIRASVVFISAPPVLYAISIDDVENPQLLATTHPQSGEMVTISGKNPYTSGPGAGISVFALLPDESDFNEIGGQDPINDGIGRPAFAKRKMIFADLSDNNGILHSAALGGFDCHHIDVGDLSADTADFEIIRARHALLKGDVVADTISLYSLIQIGDRFIIPVSGNPEGVFEAPIGSIALSDDGSIYVKTTP